MEFREKLFSSLDLLNFAVLIIPILFVVVDLISYSLNCFKR